MRDDHEAFSKLRAQVLVITRHDAQSMRDYWRKHKLPFAGIADPGGSLTEPFGQQWKLLRLGRMPAQFVVDCQGKIALAHYGSGMSDILPNQQILQTLTAVRKQSGCPD